MRRFLFLLLTICFITQIHGEEEGDCKKEELDHKLYENVNKCLEKIISQCNNTCQPGDILKKMLQSKDLQYTTMMTSKMFKKKGCGKEFNQKDGKWCEHMVKFLAKLAAESTDKISKGQKFELSDDAMPNCPKSVVDPTKDDCENAIVKHCKTGSADDEECLWIMNRKDLDQLETLISPKVDGQKLEKMYADLCYKNTESLCDYLKGRMEKEKDLQLKAQLKGVACKDGSKMKPMCRQLEKVLITVCGTSFLEVCAIEHNKECNGLEYKQEPCRDYLAGQCSEKKQDSISVKQCSDFIKVLQNTQDVFRMKLLEQCTSASPFPLCDVYANELLKTAQKTLSECDSRDKGQDTACNRVWTACKGKKKEECPLVETMNWCKEKKTAKECEEKVQSYCTTRKLREHSTLCVNTVNAVAEETLSALLETSTVCSDNVKQEFSEYCSRLAGELGKNNLGKGIFENDCENGAKMDASTKCKVLKHTCNINTATPSDVCSLVHNSQEILEEYKKIKITEDSGRGREVLEFLNKYCSDEKMENCELAENIVNRDGLSADILDQSCAENANTVCDRYFASTVEVMKQGNFLPEFLNLCPEEKREREMCKKFRTYCTSQGEKEKEYCDCKLVERVFETDTMNETVFNLPPAQIGEFYLQVCDGKTKDQCAKVEERLMEKDVLTNDFRDIVMVVCNGGLCDRFIELILKSSRFDEIYHDQCNVDGNNQERCRVFFDFCEKDANKMIEVCKIVENDQLLVKFKTDLSKDGDLQGSADTVITTCNLDENITSCDRFLTEIARKEEQFISIAGLICKEETNSGTCQRLLQKGHEMLDNAIAKMTEKECSGDTDSIICKAIHLTCENPRENVCLVHHLHHCSQQSAKALECFGYFNHYCEDITENEKKENGTDKAQTCYKFVQIMIKDRLVDSCDSKSKPCANAAKVDYQYSDSKLLSELFKKYCLKDKSSSGDALCATIRKTCENTLNTHTACSLVDEPTCQFRPFEECAPYLDKHCKEEKDNMDFCEKLTDHTLQDENNVPSAINYYCNSTDSPRCTVMLEKSSSGGKLLNSFVHLCTDARSLRENPSCVAISKFCQSGQSGECTQINGKRAEMEAESDNTCVKADADCEEKVKKFCGTDYTEFLCKRLFGKMTKDVLLHFYNQECADSGSANLCEKTKQAAKENNHLDHLFTQTCPGLRFMTGKQCKEFRELCASTETEACDAVRAPYKHTSIGCIIGGIIGVLCMCASVVWFIVKSKMKGNKIRKESKAKVKKLDSVMVP